MPPSPSLLQPAALGAPPVTAPVAIIGGGLGGLVTAFYLERAGIAYDLFEASPTHLGGTIQSVQQGPYLLEAGPNSLQLTPELAQLIADVGLQAAVIDTAAVGEHRYLLRGGQLRALPGSPPGLLLSGYFSLRTKARFLTELLRRPGAPVPATTTLAAFFRDRFGDEIVRWALDPFVAGVWAGDPERLLFREAMPRLATLADEHGSLIRGLMRSARTPADAGGASETSRAGGATARRRIISFREGAGQLPGALAASLRHLHVGAAIGAVTRAPDGAFRLTRADGHPPPHPTYSRLVLALPTYAAAPILAEAFPEFSAALAAVRYPPMAGVFLAYPRAAVRHALNGFGALYPRAEGRRAAGTIWSSALYPDRCPPDEVLLTTFVGGDQAPTAADLPDDALAAAIDTELRALYGISAAPTFQYVARWARAIPQLDAAIRPVRNALPALAPQGVLAVANWAAGVGVPDVVARAQRVAAELH